MTKAKIEDERPGRSAFRDRVRRSASAVFLAVTLLAVASLAPAERPGGGGIRHRSFFVGGSYAGPETNRVMSGQMYVEELTPPRVTHRFPLILIHGLGQTAMNWQTTPDGREGWATFFARRGWRVLMVDQPARGRSAWQPGVDPAVKAIPAATAEALFTAPEDFMRWPQAKLHSQWPGGRAGSHPGSAIFDQFFASQVASIPNREAELAMRAAGSALLDKVGPAILIVHSQAGAFGWLLADARPRLVKGIVALEPSGPPYKEVSATTDISRPWGLTITPLAYEPAPATADQLGFDREAVGNAPDLVRCWSQKEPARRLPNLRGIPILIATSEASYHAQYDHCTSRYLAQAGVANDFVRLGEHGIHGNGHMLMLEMNNLQIAAFLQRWMEARIEHAR